MNGRLVILGGGESGVGAALLGQMQGWAVMVSDAGPISKEHRLSLSESGISFEEGRHTEMQVMEAELVVKSPGIPDDSSIVRMVRNAGIPVISEVEFARKYYPGKLIGITGSNGKTTTTMLMGHLLKNAGVDALIGGNIGKSFSRIVAQGSHPEWLVLELSSFQLDNIITFRPEIAVLLNVTADHLDRYNDDIDKYAAAKLRITANQLESDWFVYYENSDVVTRNIERYPSPAQKMPVMMPSQIGQLRLSNGWVFDLETTSLIGRHNALNALCALETALLAGVDDAEGLRKGLSTFQTAAHRLERVAETPEGVTFINDSKATNVDAVKYALEAMDRPVVWIAGGTDKGNDYSELAPLVRQKVKALIALGVDNRSLIRSFDVPIVEVSSAREAVEAAIATSSPGDVVLLSPACASFDRFANYEDRGDQFKTAVRELIEEQELMKTGK